MTDVNLISESQLAAPPAALSTGVQTPSAPATAQGCSLPPALKVILDSQMPSFCFAFCDGKPRTHTKTEGNLRALDVPVTWVTAICPQPVSLHLCPLLPPPEALDILRRIPHRRGRCMFRSAGPSRERLSPPQGGETPRCTSPGCSGDGVQPAAREEQASHRSSSHCVSARRLAGSSGHSCGRVTCLRPQSSAARGPGMHFFYCLLPLPLFLNLCFYF